MTTFNLSAEVLPSYVDIARNMRGANDSAANRASKLFDLASKERQSATPNIARADKMTICGHNILKELDKAFSALRIIINTCSKTDNRIKITDATSLYYLNAKTETAVKDARKLIKKLIEEPMIQAYQDPQLMEWAQETNSEMKTVIALSKTLWEELDASLTPSIHEHYESKKHKD